MIHWLCTAWQWVSHLQACRNSAVPYAGSTLLAASAMASTEVLTLSRITGGSNAALKQLHIQLTPNIEQTSFLFPGFLPFTMQEQFRQQ